MSKRLVLSACVYQVSGINADDKTFSRKDAKDAKSKISNLKSQKEAHTMHQHKWFTLLLRLGLVMMCIAALAPSAFAQSSHL